MSWIAKCNLRINHETILKGTELDSVPKGFSQYFDEKIEKKAVKIQANEVETASIHVDNSKVRSKKKRR
jgi:hypothetical protein